MSTNGKYRVEKRPNYALGILQDEQTNPGMRMMAFQTTDYRTGPHGVYGTDRAVHPTIWRWNDEPGIWRDYDGKILPIEALSHVPGIQDELAERRILDDRDRAHDMVAAAFKGEKPDVVEERGAYALVKTSQGFEVHSSGIALTPRPVPEAIARGILDTLAGALVDVDDMPLDRVMAA